VQTNALRLELLQDGERISCRSEGAVELSHYDDIAFAGGCKQLAALRTIGERHRPGYTTLDEELGDLPALHHAITSNLPLLGGQ
jgi:hypothetical protein